MMTFVNAILVVWILLAAINAAHSANSLSWQSLSRHSRKNNGVPSLNFFLARSNDKFYEPDESSVSGTSNGKGVQIMITNKMRQTLVNELNYLESEVDNMEPQIAAVLIDRKLSRPKKGVPQSWLQPSAKKRQFNSQISNIMQHATEKALQGLNFGRTYVIPLLPIIVGGSIMFLQRDLLFHIGGEAFHHLGELKTSMIKSISSLKNSDMLTTNDDDSEEERAREDSPIDRAEEEEGVTRRRIAGTIRVPTVLPPAMPALSGPKKALRSNTDLEKQESTGAKRDMSFTYGNDKDRVNILNYDRVRRQSLWDDFRMKFTGWRKKLDF